MPEELGPGRLEWEPSTDGEKLRAIFDTVSVGIMLSDEKGIILHANNRLAEMLRCPMDELVGASYYDFLNPEAVDLARTNIDKQALGDVNQTFVERLYVCKDGTTFWGHLSGRRLERPDGTFWAMVGVIMDISARKAAEKALRESEARVRTVLEELPQIAICLDDKGVITFANKYFLNMVGMRRGQVQGGNWFDLFIPSEDRETLRQVQKEVMSSDDLGQASTFENDILVRGRPRRIAWSNVAVMSGTGKMLEVTCLGVDVTETIQTMDALRSSRQELRMALDRLRYHVENSPLAEIEWDGNGRVTSWSPVAEKMFGWAESEVMGKGWDDWPFIHKEDQDSVNVQIADMLAHGIPHNVVENRNHTKDGRTLYCQWFNSTLFDDTGRPLSILSQVQDITARVLAKQDLQASLAEKEVLLQEVHHRVKNNMQVISSLLNLQAGYLDDPAGREALQEARQRVRAMAMVHEKIYRSESFARVDMGGYLRALAGDLVQSYRAGDRITLSVDCLSVSLAMRQVVPCGLIVNELMTNALKHAFAGGRKGTVEVRARLEGGMVVLRVSDNGVGFAEGVDYRNLKGLGLQLVVNLTEQLEGGIELLPGPGAIFELRFPMEGNGGLDSEES